LGERRTASASGLTPFSIRETQYESCWRLRCVFCPVKEYSQLPIPRSRATRVIQMGWERCKGTGTGGGTHQQRCDLVQDVDDFTRGLALIDFWCRRHGWSGGELVLQRGGIRMRSLAVSHVSRAPRMQTSANRCKHQVRGSI